MLLQVLDHDLGNREMTPEFEPETSLLIGSKKNNAPDLE
jgi:hypothetical protein